MEHPPLVPGIFLGNHGGTWEIRAREARPRTLGKCTSVIGTLPRAGNQSRCQVFFWGGGRFRARGAPARSPASDALHCAHQVFVTPKHGNSAALLPGQGRVRRGVQGPRPPRRADGGDDAARVRPVSVSSFKIRCLCREYIPNGQNFWGFRK
eukprot:gene15994-biopygen23240